MNVKTVFSRRDENGYIRLASLPDDTLGFVYEGRYHGGGQGKWCITYNLVEKENGYAMRTTGSETPDFVDDKPVSGSSKREAWLSAFDEMERDVKGLENSLPIKREDAEAMKEALLRHYREDMYPE